MNPISPKSKGKIYKRKTALNKLLFAPSARYMFETTKITNMFRNTVFLVVFALAPSLALAIDSPRDTRGTVVGATEIKWEWSASNGATRYQVDVNGVFVKYVEGTSYRSTDLANGDYWFTVQAVDSNNVHSHRSERSATVSLGSGAANNNTRSNSTQNDDSNQAANSSSDIPSNVQGTQVGEYSARWTWNAVQGADSYVVYLDGDGQNPRQAYDENLVIDNLSSGNHQVKVASVNAATGKHSDQSLGAKVTIGGDFSNTGNSNEATNNNAAPPPPAPANDNGLIDPASWNYSEAHQKPGYDLVFSDEFNGNTINPARWNTQLRWDGSHNGDRYEYRLINGEAQFYVNTLSPDQEHLDKVASAFNPFEFDGSRLAIRSIKNPLKNRNTNRLFGPLEDIYRQQPFLSGVISTYGKFYQKYGYFEARIKIPSHVGTFPAFWLHHQKREWEGTQKTEIDILENLGHRTDYVYTAGHYYTGVSETNGGQAHAVKPYPQGQIFTGIDYSADYHVYAVEWNPGHIRYLIDGQEVSHINNGAFDHEELYAILNLAVGGIWTNMPTTAGGTGRASDNRFPTQQDIDTWGNPALEIDYVRFYKAQ